MIQELLKLILKGIKALYRLIFPPRKSKQIPADYSDDKPKIRIQFKDFTIEKFDIAPIWEFAINEEEEEDQDETTLRPCFGLTIADPSEGIYVVKTEFVTKTGNKYYGLCTPSLENDWAQIQPYMYTDFDLIPFWFGMIEPDIKEMEKLYEKLNLTKNDLFPIKYKALTDHKGAKLGGIIKGFMWKPIDGEKIITIN